MQLTALFTLLVAPLVLGAALPEPQNRPDTCVVLLPLIFSLPYQFTLQVQNPKYPSIHKRSVRFIGQGTPGDYRAVLAPQGSAQKLTFNDGKLSFSQGPLTFLGYAKSRNEWGVRQLAFISGSGKPLELQGYFGCDERNRQQVELSQTLYDGWDWCVQKNGKGEWGLYIESRRERRDTQCIDVKVAVRK